MRIGYARVSTHEQNLALQLDELKQAGCEKIFRDKVSGAKAERPGLEEAITYLRDGDTLVVWKLDRLGRSTKDLIEKVQELQGLGVGLMSLKEEINTTSASGKLIFHIFSALAEFERDLIRERTLAGLASARARGRKGGRPVRMTKDKIQRASELLKQKSLRVEEICKMLEISSSTLYRYLTPDGELRGNKKEFP